MPLAGCGPQMDLKQPSDFQSATTETMFSREKINLCKTGETHRNMLQPNYQLKICLFFCKKRE